MEFKVSPSKRSSEAGRLNSFDVICSSMMLLSGQITIIVGRSTEAFGELEAEISGFFQSP